MILTSPVLHLCPFITISRSGNSLHRSLLSVKNQTQFLSNTFTLLIWSASATPTNRILSTGRITSPVKIWPFTLEQSISISFLSQILLTSVTPKQYDMHKTKKYSTDNMIWFSCLFTKWRSVGHVSLISQSKYLILKRYDMLNSPLTNSSSYILDPLRSSTNIIL